MPSPILGAERPRQVIQIDQKGVDVPREVATQLQAGDGSTLLLLDRRFSYAGIAEDGVRSFTCPGAGQLGGVTLTVDAQTRCSGAVPSKMMARLKTKTYQVWGDNRFPQEQGQPSLIYCRFTR